MTSTSIDIFESSGIPEATFVWNIPAEFYNSVSANDDAIIYSSSYYYDQPFSEESFVEYYDQNQTLVCSIDFTTIADNIGVWDSEVDDMGNLYVYLSYQGMANSLNFGNGVIQTFTNSPGNNDLFVVKYDNQCNALWSSGPYLGANIDGFTLCEDTGEWYIIEPTNLGYSIKKFAANGSFIYSKLISVSMNSSIASNWIYTGDCINNTFAFAVQIGPGTVAYDGNFITRPAPPASGNQVFTFKIDGNTGNLLANDVANTFFGEMTHLANGSHIYSNSNGIFEITTGNTINQISTMFTSLMEGDGNNLYFIQGGMAVKYDVINQSVVWQYPLPGNLNFAFKGEAYAHNGKYYLFPNYDNSLVLEDFNLSEDSSEQGAAIIICEENIENFGIELPTDTTLCKNEVYDIDLTNSQFPSLEFLWSTGETSATYTINSSGTYYVTVTNPSTGCNSENSINVTFTCPELSFDISNTICTLSEGSINPIIDGGIEPFTYLWSDGSVGSSISNVASGTYGLTVTDNLGCTSEYTNLVVNSDDSVFDFVSELNHTTCGLSNGSTTITNSGGSFYQEILWDDGYIGNNRNLLSPGSYDLIVTDFNGCVFNTSISILGSNSLSTEISIQQPSSCVESLGIGSINPTNGSMPFSHIWISGETTAIVTNLNSGTYYVTTTDNNGCSKVDQIIINEYPSIEFESNINSATCSDGQIDLTITNGDEPYTFIWDNGQNTQDLNNLQSGYYAVTITDVNLCSNEAIFFVPGNEELEVEVLVNSIICQENTPVEVQVMGGAGPYNITWSNGDQTIQSTYNVGVHSVTITDAVGCSITQNFEVTNESDAMNVQFEDDKIICIGESAEIEITIEGSVGPYDLTLTDGTNSFVINNYQFSQGIDVYPTETTTYIITQIVDGQGCVSLLSDEITIDVYPEIELVLSIPDFNICSGNDGIIIPTIIGGEGPYTVYYNDGVNSYSESNFVNGNQIFVDPSIAQTYFFTKVQDLNGCELNILDKVDINITDCQISNDYQGSDPCSCNGDQTENGAKDGTFSETISVSITSGIEIWTISSVNSLVAGSALPSGIAVGNPMTYDAANNRHIFNFQHTDQSGFLIKVEGPNAVGDPNNVELEISNICKYPIIKEGVLQEEYNLCEMADLELANLNCETSNLPGTFTYLIDGIPGTSADLVNLGPGSHTIDWIFNGTFVNDFNGTPSDMAYPGCQTAVQDIIEITAEPVSIACNDKIYITLDANCEAAVTPAMLLEAEANVSYSVTLPNGQIGISTGPSHQFTGIDWSDYFATGEPVQYSIASSCGVQCWGEILFEDKINVLFECKDNMVSCSQSYEPGDPILDFEEANGATLAGNTSANIPRATNPSTPGNLSMYYDFSGMCITDRVKDIQLSLEVTDISVNKIKAYLVSPDDLTTVGDERDTITILDLVTGNSCVIPDLQLILEDNAFRSHNVLTSTLNCGLGLNHAYCGDFQPYSPFSSLSGNFTAGDWELIIENYDVDNVATIANTSIDLVSCTGTVSYPIDGNVTSLGNNEYEIDLVNNNCGPYTAIYSDEDVGPACVMVKDRDKDGNDIIDPDTGLAITVPTVTTIQRTWTITSASSGTTSTCVQDIVVKRFPTENLVMPPDYDGFDHAPFLCSDFFSLNAKGEPQLDLTMLTADSLPAPIITGMPETIFGDIDLCGSTAINFEDQKFEICGDFSYKILRTWTILDWCENAAPVTTHQQIIKVIDIEKPIVVAPADTIMVFTIGFDCQADWNIEPPAFVYDCGFALNPERMTYSVDYLLADPETGTAPVDGDYISDNVFDTDGDGIPDVIRNLPLDTTWVRYTVEDDCGNIGSALTEIVVKDNKKPTPVCTEYVVVSLGDDGCTRVEAISFDENSYDNCGVERYEVRRLDIVDDFDPYVDYCCEDFGKELIVELKVLDHFGNFNTCITKVVLQNPLQFAIAERPEDIELDCRDLDQLPTGASFEDDFVVINNLNDAVCPHTIVCEDPKEISAINECGNGRYVVNCTITSGIGEVLTENIQITFTNTNVFDSENGVDWSPLEAYTTNILDSCPNELTLDPENSDIGMPIILDYECSQMAITYEDQIFDEVENACLRILRTWTIIDWCTYDPNDGSTDGIATHVQVIKINDIELPEFNCPVTLETLYGSGTGCYLNTSGIDTIGILVLSEEEGFDECSDLSGKEVDVTYEIDYHKDGTIDSLGTGRNANGVHQFGCHFITWTIVDYCENVNSCTYEFCIQDDKAPTPYCLSEAVVVTMNETGSATVWANEFDLGSTDNITGNCNYIPLEFTLMNPENGLSSNNSLTFDCDDIPNGISQEIPLQMWVTDEFGNSDYCEVTLIFQDNSHNACDSENDEPSRVGGYVYTEENEMIEDAMISINGAGYTNQITTTAGEYLFDNIPMNSSYMIDAEKEDNVLNGLSTLDLVLIQKHILGIEELSSPYKIIAADANKNQSVSAIDLIVLRKLILGINSSFPNDEMPWRFVESTQEFADDSNPFPYNEQIALNNVDQLAMNEDFVAIKIGDVNGTAAVNNLQSGTSTRSSKNLELVVKERKFKAGEIVEVPVSATNFNDMVGYQFTIWVNPSIAEVVNIDSGALALTDENFGYTQISEGFVTTSWNEMKGVSISANEALFTISVKATKDTYLSEILNINDSVTYAESYDSGLTVMGVDLLIEGSHENSGYELFQNRPNPFTNKTTIGFKLPKASSASIKIFTVDGKLIKTMTDEYETGINTIVLEGSELEAQGVLYYQLETEGFTATKKMILLD